MQKKNLIPASVFFLIFLITTIGLNTAYSQIQKTDILSKDSTGIFADDPIAAMLDSLSRLQFFDSPSIRTEANKYGFAGDSIPNYSDSIYALRLNKLDEESPFELVYNNAVRNYIEMYAVRKRATVQRMLGLSQLYFPLIEEILDRKKIPLELKYLAIVESALNPKARSRVGAMGMWQFMYGTGKMMGLKTTSYVDERCDLYRSTEAACDYIQFLYNMFGDWQMVLAAYNGGPGTVSKAIRRSGGKNTYWEIRPYLPRETQGYVPAFIAVNYVMTHAEEHNLYPVTPRLTFADIDTVNLRQELSFHQIAKAMDMTVEEVQYLNPSYKRQIIPHSEENCYSLCLPTAKIGSFITNEAQIYEYAKKDSTMQTLAIKQITKVHIVRKGEVLSRVAARYDCTPEDLKAWNHLRSSKLNIGQKLTVYINVKAPIKSETVKATAVADTTKTSTSAAAKSSAENIITEDNVKVKLHVVQKGDSLWGIAQSNGVTIEDIKQWNKLDGGKIIPGQKIKIRVAG